MTYDQRAEQYSAKLSNQTGKYTKGEIETTYAVACEEATLIVKEMAIKAYKYTCIFDSGCDFKKDNNGICCCDELEHFQQILDKLIKTGI